MGDVGRVGLHVGKEGGWKSGNKSIILSKCAFKWQVRY